MLRMASDPEAFSTEPTRPWRKSESESPSARGPVISELPTYCESCPIFSARVMRPSKSEMNRSASGEKSSREAEIRWLGSRT